jgi:hypothetical protein
MVEKRTLVFLMLATIVWATLATAFVGFYYLQNSYNTEQLNNAQDSLDKVASNYNKAVNKYDSLLSNYASLYGNYAYFSGSDYGALMPTLEGLIENFSGSYANLFTQEDISKSYNQLSSDYETLLAKGNVTKTDFGNILGEYYGLFSLSALREQELSISEVTTLSVNIEIDYGNGTVEWHNKTSVPSGSTLFQLAQNLTTIKYTYYALSEPGHVLIDSINNVSSYTDSSYAWGYSWIWYHWNDNEEKWIGGMVGCDAWLLENGGAYKWNYERWSYP